MKQGKHKSKPLCPKCGTMLDAYTGLGHEHAMKPGDITLCAYCATPLEWTGDGYAKLTGPSLVLARLRPDFVAVEALARHTRAIWKRR